MTAPYYADEAAQVFHGDCLDVLAELPDASVDAVVTDPPYGLEFMGREWDSFKPAGAHARARTDRADEMTDENKRRFIASAVNQYAAGAPFQRWCELWAAECLRVLKPGGHLLAFGGTRTWHRLTCAIEDAGFEIRDSIAWLYGSGFPKSLDVSKAIDKAAGAQREVVGPPTRHGGGTNAVYAQDEWTQANQATMGARTASATDDARKWAGFGTALKPAFEPVVVARKPLSGTVAANVLQHGTGALNIDGCRVQTADDLNGGAYSGEKRQRDEYASTDTDPGAVALSRLNRGIGEYEQPAGRWPSNVVLDDTQATELDRQSGVTASPNGPVTQGKRRDGSGWDRPVNDRHDGQGVGYGDQGGASRYFPTFRYEAKAPTAERPRDGATAHPTVKPLDLMRWLVRLVTPPGGLVLDPFAGSGTTAEACILEGFRCVAVEREADYLPLIVGRLTKPLQPALDFGEPA